MSQGMQLSPRYGPSQELAAQSIPILAQYYPEPTGAVAAFMVPRGLDQGRFCANVAGPNVQY